MLHKLELTNFKKHTDLAVNFLTGLNVIRAANESGKSTLYEAIAYALWGARALPLSLDEVVTWGVPVTRLKVSLTFSISGVEYKVIRSKSGAELSGGVTAAGHAAVTAEIERIMGASMHIGMATLNASQGSLQSTLSSESLSLIEKLSNLGLIDKIISAVQENLPSGSTRLLEQRLAEFSSLFEPVLDTTAENLAISDASKSLEISTLITSARKSELEGLIQPAKAAEAAIAKAKSDNERRSKLQRELAANDYSQVITTFTCEYTADELREKIAIQAKERTLLEALRSFEKLPKFDTVAGTVEQTRQAHTVACNEVDKLDAEVRKLQQDLAITKATGIWEDTCSLCKKDLRDVPEVAQVNAKVEAKCSDISTRLDKVRAELAEWAERRNTLKLLLKNNTAYDVARTTLRGFVEFDATTCPETPRWVGGQPALDYNDYESMLRSLVASEKKVQDARVQEARRLEKVSQIQEQLNDLGDIANTAADHHVLAAFGEASEISDRAEAERRRRVNDLAEVKHALSLKVVAFESAKALYAERLQQKVALESDISAMVKTNELIKKLREARPVVAARLWNLVMGGVSSIFSEIRGVASTVTRGDSKFLIDGKDAAAFSGSTKDALGLAIRLMLTKTFMPNISFVLLDEIGASSDLVRESAMLGAVLAAGMPQTVLVTHSDVADNFASQIVEL